MTVAAFSGALRVTTDRRHPLFRYGLMAIRRAGLVTVQPTHCDDEAANWTSNGRLVVRALWRDHARV